MSSDMFEFRVTVKERPHTRRGILSMISQVYDPLGFIQPFVLPMKRLMQGLCNLKIGWDDPLPLSAIDKWRLWLENVPFDNSVALYYKRIASFSNFRSE